MSNYFGVLQLGLLASLSFAVLVAIVSAVIYPLVRQRMTELTPRLRSNILLAWLVAPALIGGLLSILSFMPSLFSMFGGVPDHCSVHDGHLHLCLIHPPLPADSMYSSLLMMLLEGVVLVFFAIYTICFLRACKLQRALMITSRQHAELDVRIVEWDGPLAISAGIWRIRVFISEKLMQTLTPRQLDVVLAHELAHMKRKDPLRHLLGHTFSLTHIPWLRKRLLADMDHACEQACDEFAASKTGDRLHVAATIVFVERLFNKQQLPFTAMSITGSNISQRVESLLLDPAEYRPGYRAYLLIVAVVLIVLFSSVEELHHQTESILGFVTRI